MSKFIELHPKGDSSPMMINLDTVQWIGETENGNALVKFISRREKDTLSMSVYQESYLDVRNTMTKL